MVDEGRIMSVVFRWEYRHDCRRSAQPPQMIASKKKAPHANAQGAYQKVPPLGGFGIHYLGTSGCLVEV